MSALKTITTGTFKQDVLSADKPVLVDFYTPWCPGCQVVAPHLETLAEEYAGRVDVVKIDVEQEQDLALQLGITSVPTLVLFKEGEPVQGAVGAPTPGQLREWLDHAA
jgi:thioredoxin 1